MSVSTLLKGQFRQRKSAWISIFLLCLIATVALNFSLSSLFRLNERAQKAGKESALGDMIYYFFQKIPSPEVRGQADELEEVGKTLYLEQVVTANLRDTTVNGKESNIDFHFQPYPQDDLKLPIFKEDFSAFEEGFPAPKAGDVYVPVSFRDDFSCKVGDAVRIDTANVKKTYRIAGFVENILQVRVVSYGVRYIYMNAEDYADLDALLDRYPEDLRRMAEIHVYRSESAKDMSLQDFAMTLSDRTEIPNEADVRIDRSDMVSLSTQMSNIYMVFLLIFAGLLYILTLIVIQFHVNASLEEEYRNLGALKAVGCNNAVLRRVYLVFFSSSVLLALVIGTALAALLMRFSQGFFLTINSLLIDNALAGREVLVVMAGILLFTMLFVSLKLRKIGKISPLRALTEGRSVRKSCAVGLPLAPRFLNFRIALRQLFGSMRQYVGALIVIAIMLFFILTVSSIITAMEPDRMMADYYGFDFDVEISYKDLSVRDEVEAEMADIAPVVDSYALDFRALEYEGIPGGVYVAESGDAFSAMIEGRPPQNENEVALTRIMSEKINLGIGDRLTLKIGDREATYLVTGTYQSLNNIGRSFGMLLPGIRRLDPEFEITTYSYLLEDRLAATDVNEQLMKKFTGDIEITDAEEIRGTMRELKTNSDRLTALVTAVSLIFVLISCYMVANKLFLRERMEYGIYKSIGMRSGNLRRIFSLRFLLVSILGSLVGYLLYVLGGDPLVIQIFRAIGISEFEGQLSLGALLLPAIFLILAFTGFAWLVSGKIKRVEVRELIVE